MSEKHQEHQRTGYKQPFIATDIIIEYNDGHKEGIVLIDRKNEPHGLALPGGFAEYGLTLEQNAQKEAREETGLGVLIQYPENPFCVHSNPHRDPRAHVISVAYVAEGKGTLRAGDDAQAAVLYSLSEVVDLLGKDKFAFPDHERIIIKYLQKRLWDNE